LSSSRLTKLQRNDIFDLVRAARLDPHDFELNHGERAAILSCTRSDSLFTIAVIKVPLINVVSYSVKWVIAAGDIEDNFSVNAWDNVKDALKKWLFHVKRDIDTPDLWAGLRRDTAFLSAASAPTLENTPFTFGEQQQIAEQLRAQAATLKQHYALSPEQEAALNENIEILIEASTRVGRKDWQLLFSGVLFTWLTATALPPEAVRHFLAIVAPVIGHLFGLAPMVLG
jgi:hypothetical protein